MISRPESTLVAAITYDAIWGQPPKPERARVIPDSEVGYRGEAEILLQTIRDLSRTALVGLVSDEPEFETQEYTTKLNKQRFATGWLWAIDTFPDSPSVLTGVQRLLTAAESTQLDIAIGTPKTTPEFFELANLAIMLGEPRKDCPADIAIWPDGRGTTRRTDFSQKMYKVQDRAGGTTDKIFKDDLKTRFKEILSRHTADLPAGANQ